MSTRKQDADKQTIEDEAAAEVREGLRAHDEINEKINESTSDAAAPDPWKGAKFTTEEFRAHIPPQPLTLWQRVKSWMFD